MPLPYKTALLVDDDAAQRIVLELLLQDCGIDRVLVAHDAEGALSLLRTQPVDLLVCDLGLPGKDGVSLLREIGPLPRPPAVVIVSGVDSGLLQAAARLIAEMGVRLLGALSKPLRAGPLQALLSAALERPHGTPAGDRGDDPVDDACLLGGLAQGWYEPFYEARIGCESGRVEGVELLARLCPPGRAAISPMRFIPRLEALGRVAEMTWQIADAGFGFVRRWRAAGLGLSVSLNLSPTLLHDADLVERLSTLAQAHRLEAREVTLEITESAAIDLSLSTLERLVHLRLRGFGLSIDDFGTGFSSLTQLSKVPFTEMKIDRSFTAEMQVDAKALAVVESSVSLARRLGLRICAEGVESGAILQRMRALRVDTVQGYHFHRPMPATAFEAWAGGWNRALDAESARPVA